MNILEAVNANYETLSSVQKRIADYIFKYPDEVCFYSLKDLSEALGVTEVTILRFAKKIGLANYVELKKLLREHLQSSIARGDTLNRISDRVGTASPGDGDKDRLYRDFVSNELAVLQNTYRNLKAEDLLEAVSILKGAECVYVIGNELISGIAAYLARRLMTIGLKVVDLSSLSRALYNNTVSHIGPEDAVIVFSLPGYAKHVVNTTKYLEKRQVPQIILTDKKTAPSALHGTTVLTCDNHDLFFFNSTLGFLSVSSLLTYMIAMDDVEETNRRRGKLSEAREAIGSVAAIQNSRV